jgi:hypothetical protein
VEPMGLRLAPNCEHHMTTWRFETIRYLLRKIYLNSSVDPWKRFRLMVDEYNADRRGCIYNQRDSTFGDSMRENQPASLDKLDGILNVSSINRK